MSLGGIMSTLGGYHDECGGISYHEYTGGIA